MLPLQDQVHILASCDLLVSGGASHANTTGLPCLPIVGHADGSLVSAFNPATSGEEVVAYASGLGQTNPPATTGKPLGTPSPTVNIFNMDFNFRPNALATKPTPIPSLQGIPIINVPVPLFSGMTSGYVGLYQINFVVPTIPAGTPACLDPSQVAVGGTYVQSNLTVSFGSAFSFDGAGICVAPTL